MKFLFTFYSFFFIVTCNCRIEVIIKKQKLNKLTSKLFRLKMCVNSNKQRSEGIPWIFKLVVCIKAELNMLIVALLFPYCMKSIWFLQTAAKDCYFYCVHPVTMYNPSVNNYAYVPVHIFVTFKTLLQMLAVLYFILVYTKKNIHFRYKCIILYTNKIIKRQVFDIVKCDLRIY